VFFLELFFVAKVAIINRNQRFAFFFGKNFRQSEKNKRKNNILSQYSLLRIFFKNPPNFEKEIFFKKF
jgi:hypothetical protein